MGITLSVETKPLPRHTCKQAQDPKQIHLSPCQRCQQNAFKQFQLEAELRTKACLFPEKYKLESYHLDADPNWCNHYHISKEAAKVKEQAIKDIVAIYCQKDTLPRHKRDCHCQADEIAMQQIHRKVAVELADMQPQVHLSFEPPKSPIRTPRPVVGVKKVEEDVFVIGDADADDEDVDIGKVGNKKTPKARSEKTKVKRVAHKSKYVEIGL